MWLLKVLRRLTAGVDEQANEYLNFYNGIAKLYSMKQFKTEMNDADLDRFILTCRLWTSAMNHLFSSVLY